jgi:hypothetical protein
LPPEPATWRVGTTLTGARFRNEHLTAAFQDTALHYWHVQTITIGQLNLTLARGLRPGMGLEAIVPLRLVRSRIRYEDPSRHPFIPPYPDYHHRNETPVRFSDPTFSFHVARVGETWTVAGRLGLSIPLGRTEANPFALGRLGLPHEHFQFGTGTWDPVLTLAVGRQAGSTALTASAFGHLTFYENTHGYRAGDRYNVTATAAHALRGPWGGSLAFDVTREEAEHWSGRLEAEGNLGRTDALVSVGVGRPLGDAGALALALGIPVYSRVRGEQGNQPLVFSVSWSRSP